MFDSMIGEVVKSMAQTQAILPKEEPKKHKPNQKAKDVQRYIVLAASRLEKNDREEEMKNEQETKKIK